MSAAGGPYNIIDWSHWTALGDRSLNPDVTSYRGTAHRVWTPSRRPGKLTAVWVVTRPDGTAMPGRFPTLKAASAARVAEART